MKKVILSIITVTRNPGSEILKTISGISQFLSEEVEFVLVDGNSDEPILNSMIAQLPENTKFLSEPDMGIYDAMNKAWEMAEGKYLLFLNHGDELLWIPNEILRGSDADVLLGSVLLDNGLQFQGRNSVLLQFRNLWPHQGTFYKRESSFRYNSSLKIFADFDLNQRLYRTNSKIQFLPVSKPLARHQAGGVSGDPKGLNEFYSIIRANYGLLSVAISFLWFKLEGFRKKLIQPL